MRVKKSIIFAAIVLALISFGMSSLMLSAAQNGDYIVLINDADSPITFAGVNYSISEDLKELSLEFQVMDAHTYKDKQGIRFSVICGEQKGEVFADADSLTVSDDAFFSLRNTLNKIDAFSSHSNIQMSFEITFSKKISEDLILEAEFIDASGLYSEKTSCVLYSADEPTENSIDAEGSTSEKDKENTVVSEKETVGVSQHTNSNSYSNNYSYSNSGNSYSQSSQSYGVTETAAMAHENTQQSDYENTRKTNIGAQQIVAIVLAVFLIIAAVICIVLGIKKSKVN